MFKGIVLTFNFHNAIALNHETSNLRCSIRGAEILLTVKSKKHTRNSFWFYESKDNSRGVPATT